MKTRIVTGAGMIVALLFALYMGGWVFATLWILAVCLSMREMFAILVSAGHRPVAWPAWLALAVSVPAFTLFSNGAGVRVMLAVSLLSGLLATVFVLFRSAPRLEDLLFSMLPLLTVALPGMCLLGVTGMEPQIRQRALLSLTFFVPIVGDAAAYFVGVRFGRVKLNPPVSPKKTVEGAMAGLAGSAAAAVAVFLLFSSLGSGLPPFWHFLLIGLAGGVVGQVGDLFASLVKRYCGVKDYSNLFPGHGGMMDRLDSILSVSVLVFAYQAILF